MTAFASSIPTLLSVSRFSEEQIIGLLRSTRRGPRPRRLPPARNLERDLLQTLVLVQRVGHAKATMTIATLAQLNLHLVVVLGDVERYQNRGLRRSVAVGHGW